MNLAEWRAAQQSGEEGVLPSGLDVVLKKVSIVDLAASGQIPQTLAVKLNGIMKGGEVASVDLSQMAEYASMVEVVAKACIVEPAELDVKELPFEDKLAVFNWANEGVSQLNSFRPIKKAGVGAASDGQNIQPATQFVVGAGS